MFNATVTRDNAALIFAFVDFFGSGWLLDDVSVASFWP